MKQIICVITLLSMLISCESEKDISILADGTWRNEQGNKGLEIVMRKGFYMSTRWDHDVVIALKGRYFINKNDKRSTFTITFIPDPEYVGNDTIISPCDNIDVLFINDSVMAEQKNTDWSFNGKERIVSNTIALYKKQVNK